MSLHLVKTEANHNVISSLGQRQEQDLKDERRPGTEQPGQAYTERCGWPQAQERDEGTTIRCETGTGAREMGNPKIKIIDCGMVHSMAKDLGVVLDLQRQYHCVCACSVRQFLWWNIPTEANLELFMELQRSTKLASASYSELLQHTLGQSGHSWNRCFRRFPSPKKTIIKGIHLSPPAFGSPGSRLA